MLAKIVGTILCLCSLICAVLWAVVVVRLYPYRLPLDVGELIGFIVFFGAAAVFSLAGFRLIANRRRNS